MNVDAFLALVRREVLRGRRLLITVSVATGLSLLLAMAGGETATLLAIVLAMVGSLLTMLGPSGDLGGDKMLGHLEADRVLPVSTRLVAAGRLVGASVRLLPIGVAALAMAVLLVREVDAGPLGALLMVIIPIGALVFASMASWTLLGLNARWQFRNLWWLPITLFVGPQIAGSILPPGTKAAIARWASGAASSLAGFALTPLGVVTGVLMVTLLPVAVFLGTMLLFASGLERYRYDANALGAVLGKAPTRELGAIGRGPLLAVARLRLRLALEQQRRQGIFLLILVLVVVVGTQELREFAVMYVRVFAIILPAGIAFQLTAARGMGHLEGMQQLPHPARTIALGHLAAIAVMAVPGAAIMLLSRAMDGRRVGLVDGVMAWGWFTIGAWITAVLAVWLKPRYLAILVGGIVLLLVSWYGIAGGPGMGRGFQTLVEGFRSLRASAGVALPIGAALLAAAIGVPVFARGVEKYQFQAK